MEQWTQVVGWPDYEIDPEGRVRSLARSWIRRNGVRFSVAERVLVASPDKNGRPQVSLHDRTGRSKKVRVSTLMAQTFHGPCPEGQEIRHLNDVSGDNQLGNLEYGTHADNVLDMVRNGNHNNARKARCPEGHEYTPENTYFHDGRRNCRECHRKAGREYARRRRLRRSGDLA